MATKKRASRGQAHGRLSPECFLAEHDDLIEELFGTSGHKQSVSLKALATGTLTTSPPNLFLTAVSQLKRTSFSRILKTAGRENSPEAFKEILELLLHLLRVEIPAGVFTPMRKAGKPGRPISIENVQIYSRWVEMGQPSPSKNDLAQAFYGESFTEANGIGRRKLRDKCRQAVERYLERLIAELHKESAKQRKEISRLERQLDQYEKTLAERKAARP
jgi:hypothetical protein